MSEHNKPTLNDEATLALRDQCHKRAICLYLTLDGAEKAGITDNEWLWQAMKRYGYDTGENLEKAMKDPCDMREFAEHFGVGLDRNIYEMETTACDDDKYYLKFHYCPFVKKWRDMGLDEELLPKLCDLAMQGDHGVGETFEKHGIKFTLGKTIAQGNPTCDLFFDKIR